jgi:hypothetical protein
MAELEPSWKVSLNAFWQQEGRGDNERALLLMDMLSEPAKYGIQPNELEEFRAFADGLLADLSEA